MDESENGGIKVQIAGLCFAILDVIQRLEIFLYFSIIREWLFHLFNTHDDWSRIARPLFLLLYLDGKKRIWYNFVRIFMLAFHCSPVNVDW